MHARILLLPGSENGNASCACAEQILTDISASFNHRFTLIRGKLQEEVSDDLLSQCESSQAVLLGDAQCPGGQRLLDALGLPLRVRSLCVPEAACGRHEKPVKLYLGTVLSLDEETLRDALEEAFRFAREEDVRILHVSPTGAAKAEWDAAIRAQAAANPLVTVDAIAAPAAAHALIAQPGRLGLLLCPPYAGGILEAAATAHGTHPEMMYDFAPGDPPCVYAPLVPHALEDASEALPPFAMGQAVARMLRASLRLTREAACLDAAIQNVLSNYASGASSLEGEERSALDLICDQIAVAGELMGRSGILS